MMRSVIGLLLAALPASADEVTLKNVKYEDLAKFVAGQRGKVVVVDFWASYCVPCRKAFPHLVALHRKNGGRGFVAVSVSVDDVKDKKAVTAARAFLSQQQATMTNFLLDEVPAVWLKKLKSDGVPVVFVFNRDGQIERKWTEAPDAEEMDQLIEKLLAAKGAP